ncbi:MAG TPA: hypothetical protein VN737_15035 [Bryobacteraceae bacterium]|nr:hypothetical protein [Bryobacteraceae bacterium]
MLRSMIVLGLAGLMSLTCLAQSDASASGKKPTAPQTPTSALKKSYHLTFVVQELDNERVINSRSYSMIMSEMGQSSIRAGEKVPYSSTTGANTEWQQIDVGVNIDCRGLQATDNGVSLNIKADISSVMESHGANSAPASPPIIRNNQWESNVVLPLKQPSVLFSSDDPASKRRMQLQLTITPIR